MKRAVQIFISILMAVLCISTAFADSLPQDSTLKTNVDTLLDEVRETVIKPYHETAQKRLRTYAQVFDEMARLNDYAARIEQNGEKAEKLVEMHLCVLYSQADELRVTSALSLDWKLLGTLLFTYGEKMTDVLKRNLRMHIDDMGRIVEIRIEFNGFDDLLWLDNETDWFAARNSYYYLNTVYDDAGVQRKPSSYCMAQEKLDSLAFPLDAKWYSRIKTKWYRSRDGGRRVHTGMDIRCAHGSPIYACAGGTVSSVGYHVKGGYYVSVVDDDGYEYFYYHMIKNSQCVVRGQIVETGERLGLSGNTGNSAAPHLHLSIITPERRFVDPFPIYYRWVYQHTGKLIKKPS